jgi:two-component system, NtrC family, sensor kinase
MKFFTHFNPLTRTLRTQLALYFIPVSILPAVAISFYATRIFEETTRDTLLKRASSERDAIVAEIDNLENESLGETRAHAVNFELVSATRSRETSRIAQVLSRWKSSHRSRVYTLRGQFLGKRDSNDNQIAFITSAGLENLKRSGTQMSRYFVPSGKGFVTTIRTYIHDSQGRYGVLEEEWLYGEKELGELKNRRQVDIALLTRALKFRGWSLAVPEEAFHEFGKGILTNLGHQDPVFTRLGDSRYAAFLYNLPMNSNKIRDWGYLAVFLPMGAVDDLMLRLKTNLIFITAIVIWVFALLIFFFSNRIVKPIEMLVIAMKRVKTGRVEEIPPIDSTYEIEYLVQAFNEMTRNVSDAKRALELKLEELRRANQEIKNTQSTLVQSAKMISLGQIVAGVAHELNNPIAFIYSNMHHLNEYLDKFSQLVKEYRRLSVQLPEKTQKELSKKEADLEIDYILKDMSELIKSVVDGANRTKDIVTGLRTFSRMDEAIFRSENIEDGLKSTLKLLNAEFRGRVTVHEEYGGLPLVECNISQLNQVFMNLLTNASHAIEGKGEIWVRTRAETEHIRIEIEDTGAGIAPQHLEKIFDPFFTTKKVGQGTGLGLSIAYGLIQKHQGEIAVRSHVGKGTKFIITLPIHQSIKRTA